MTAIVQAVSSVRLRLMRGDAEVESHPVLDLLEDGHNCGNTSELMGQTAGYAALSGEAFWCALGAVGRKAMPSRLYVPPPWRMTEKTAYDDEDIKALIGWEYRNEAGRRKPFLPEEVGQLKHFNPYSKFRGLSGLDAAKLSVEMNVAANRLNRASLLNNAEPGGVLESDQNVDEPTATGIKEKWKDKHGGPDRAREIAVLFNGLKFKATQRTLTELAWPEGKKLSRGETLAALGVPPIVGGIVEDANRANSDIQFEIFWLDRIFPELSLIKAVLNQWLLARYPNTAGHEFGWDTSGIPVVQQLELRKTEALDRLVKNGVPRNDALEFLGLDIPPTEAGKHWWVGMGQQPADYTLEAGPGGDVGPKLPEGEEGEGTGNGEQGTEEEEPAKSEKCEARSEKLSRDEERRRRRLWLAWVASWRGLEKRGRAALVKHFSRQSRELIKRLRRVWPAPAKSDPQIAQMNTDAEKRTLSVPSVSSVDESAVRKDVVEEILLELDAETRRLRAVLVPLIEDSAELGIRQGLDETAGEVDESRVAELTQHPEVRRVIRVKRIRIAGIERETRRRVRAALETGLREGKTVQQMAARIERLTGKSGPRSVSIARTEVGSATSAGRHAGLKGGGAKGHGWLSARDDLVREDHAGAEREYFMKLIPIEEPFVVGAERLMHPGDPTGSPGQIINCRCVETSGKLRVNHVFYSADRMSAVKGRRDAGTEGQRDRGAEAECIHR